MQYGSHMLGAMISLNGRKLKMPCGLGNIDASSQDTRIGNE